MANIVKVRKAVWGASPVDEDIESGSDVDFDEDVDMESRGEDGATRELDVERTFELVVKNGLIIRLQVCTLLTLDRVSADLIGCRQSSPQRMDRARSCIGQILEAPDNR